MLTTLLGVLQNVGNMVLVGASYATGAVIGFHVAALLLSVL